jgi:hypothetical protein
LTPWLTQNQPSLAAVDEILQSPALHRECIDLLPQLEAHIVPAGAEGVKSVLGKLFAIFPQPDRSASEWAAWWEAYLEDLAGFPLWALEAAARDYRRDAKSEFFPKPGPLRELANQHAIQAVRALGIARMVAKHQVRQLIPEAKAEANRQAMAELASQIGERK